MVTNAFCFRSKWSSRSLLAALSLLGGGCIPAPETTVVRSEYRPVPEKEWIRDRTLAPPRVQLIEGPTGLQAAVSRDMQCAERIPMVRTVENRREASVLAQVGNVAGFVGFGALGGAMVAGCSTTTCTDKQEKQTLGIGGASIVGAVLFGAAFVFNAVRARDPEPSLERSEGTSSQWRACGTQPLASAPVSFLLSDGKRIDTRTDGQGIASLEPPAIAWTDGSLSKGTISLVLGSDSWPVSLSGLRAYESWQARDKSARSARTGNASSDAWQEAREQDSAAEDSVLKQEAARLAGLEAAAEPWTDDQLRSWQAAFASLGELQRRRKSVGLPEDARCAALVARWRGLQSNFERGLAAKEDREWGRVASSCQKATHFTECQGVIDYLGRWKPARHEVDAKKLFATARVQKLHASYQVELQREEEAAQVRRNACLGACRGQNVPSDVCRSRCL